MQMALTTRRELVEVVDISSDDDRSSTNSRDTPEMVGAASAIITNEKPLNLELILPSFTQTMRPSIMQQGATIVSQKLLQKQQRTQAALRIKSRTDVPYTKTVLPLSASRHNGASVQVNGEKKQFQPIPVTRDVIKPVNTEIKWDTAEFNVSSSTSDYLYETKPVPSDELSRSPKGPYIFRCQYGQCRRKIYGNVSFINHVWAHTSAFKNSTAEPICIDGRIPFLANSHGNRVQRSPTDRICVCPYCNTQYRTPFLMQVHITRAHSCRKQALSPFTCEICEREVPQLEIHIKKYHEVRDMPYTCHRCQYRASTRIHLIRHVIAQHSSTNHLACPLCSEQFKGREHARAQRRNPSPTESDRRILFSPEFINHMIMHENGARFACDKCALSFVDPEARQDHRREHGTQIALRDKCQVVDRERNKPLGTVFVPPAVTEDVEMCGDCVPDESGEGRKMCIKCAHAYFTLTRTCEHMKEGMLGIRDGADSAQESIAKCVCECGFVSYDGNRMASHAAACFGAIKTERIVLPTTEAMETNADANEAAMFGVSLFNSEEAQLKEEMDEEAREREAAKLMLERNPFGTYLQESDIGQEALNMAIRLLITAVEEKTAENLRIFADLKDRDAVS